jgi:hypothetical protein
MKWVRIIVAVLIVVIVGGAGVWGYRFFYASESVEAISSKWALSGHADAESESFVHWVEDEPPEIPVFCAKCHSMDGYVDFLGADGSAARQVDSPVLGVSILACRTCHNEPAHEMTEVTFPSDIVVEEGTQSTTCMQCHQGRRSTDDVNEALAGLAPDAMSEDLNFINVHYAIAAATLWGGEVEVGYQYSGKSYVGRFEHVEGYDTCIECHDPHATARNPDECSPCHLNVVDEADLREIRESEVDYDGDGDVEEPILTEVTVFHEELYAAIQAYAEDVIGEPIVYEDSFPYFFNDPEGGEVTFADQYASWTPRLVRAAYNYHYVHEDPGAYTHNAEYVLQLMYDSMEDLGEAVTVELEGFVRP